MAAMKTTRRSTRWCARPPTTSGKAVGILVDLQGPKIRLGTVRRRADQRRARATSSPSPRATSLVTRTSARRRTRVSAATSRPGRRDPDRRRPGPAHRDRGQRHRREDHGRGRAAVLSNNKGINLPGVRGQRPRHEREGHRGPALGAAPARGHDRAVVRPVRRGRRRRTPDHGRGEGVDPGHRQDREAAGDRPHRRHHRRLRRRDGGARRPRRRDAARGRALPAEDGHRGGPPQRQAGHRRDPDARVDDLGAAPDPRRGLRRRQRGPRRCRRGHAVG